MIYLLSLLFLLPFFLFLLSLLLQSFDCEREQRLVLWLQVYCCLLSQIYIIQTLNINSKLTIKVRS